MGEDKKKGNEKKKRRTWWKLFSYPIDRNFIQSSSSFLFLFFKPSSCLISAHFHFLITLFLFLIFISYLQNIHLSRVIEGNEKIKRIQVEAAMNISMASLTGPFAAQNQINNQNLALGMESQEPILGQGKGKNIQEYSSLFLACPIIYSSQQSH